MQPVLSATLLHFLITVLFVLPLPNKKYTAGGNRKRDRESQIFALDNTSLISTRCPEDVHLCFLVK